jgi:acetylornithine/succinyldiaminopimelate/putrescine aminotransferase
VWDVDGNEYIDLVMGVGTLILSYCAMGLWQRLESESHQADANNDHPYRFEVMVRK